MTILEFINKLIESKDKQIKDYLEQRIINQSQAEEAYKFNQDIKKELLDFYNQIKKAPN